MTELQIFNNERFGEIRAMEIDGDPWFCLSDICKPLGLKASKCKDRLKPDGVRHRDLTDSLGRPANMLFVSEPNLYRAIFQSARPEAEPFIDWVTEEVLPALRRHGAYATTHAAPCRSPDVSPSGLAKLITVTRRVMLDMNSTPVQVGKMACDLFRAYDFPVPAALLEQTEGQLSLWDRPGLDSLEEVGA